MGKTFLLPYPTRKNKSVKQKIYQVEQLALQPMPKVK
jgi:hypothetical protein